MHPEVGLLSFFGAAFVLSALLSALARPVSRKLNFVDKPDLERKQGRGAVPYGGGLAMLVPFLCGLVGLWLCWRAGPRLVWLLVEKGAERPGPAELARLGIVVETATLRRLGFIALGGLVVFVMGLLDDVRKIRPVWKFLVQVLAALLLVAAGVRVTALIPSTTVSVILTVLWVVGITNSFNLLDNMDGLSAGIAAIAAFIFAMVLMSTGQLALAMLLALLAGSAAGLLTQNFHPARLYMGDAGSYWLGFTLSALTVEATFYRSGQAGSKAMLAVGVPLLIMAVPLFDTLTVLWIRLREGRPIWVGDRSHLSHRLTGMGLSVRQAVLTIYLLTLACGIGALLLKDLPAVGGVLILAQAAAILAVVAILEGLGRRARNGQ